MRIRKLLCLLMMSFIALSGCSPKSSKDSAAKTEDIQPAAAHQSMPSDANAELQFSAPADWIKETPASSNRKAQYKLPRAAGDGEDAEMAVYHFPGGGGTTQANIDRWLGQFTKADGSPAGNTAKITKKTIGSIPVTIVDVSGTYAGSMMMQQAAGAKPNFRMLAAIAETKSGPWFFKLTGPENIIKKYQSGFDALIISLREQ